MEACRDGRTVNIYCDAVVSNKGRNDGKQLGTASAVLYHEGREYGHIERTFGESVTEADALTRSFMPGLDLLTRFLINKPAQHQVLVVFLTPSVPALNRALDASPHEEQTASIDHLTKLGELLSTYPNIEVRLQWLPRKVPFIGFRRARQLAFEAIRTADPTDQHEPQSIKKLKDTTKRAAITAWEGRYNDNPTHQWPSERPYETLRTERHTTPLTSPPNPTNTQETRRTKLSSLDLLTRRCYASSQDTLLPGSTPNVSIPPTLKNKSPALAASPYKQ
jgi:hypothetical protein